jgi:hypothetical protein
MSSVLAIVSKALFEKMVPKDVKLGAVVDTNSYMSNNKTFDGLADGGAIFLVTVRPPDEKLWLVGILENPKKKGETWTAAANEAPLTDITAAIKKLEFASGTGLKAKKGALGMSLQTPRGLTDDDVKLLRGMIKGKPVSGKVHAKDAYMKAVDEVVHKHKKGGKLGKFRLENRRKPFKGKAADLEASEDGLDLRLLPRARRRTSRSTSARSRTETKSPTTSTWTSPTSSTPARARSSTRSSCGLSAMA